MTTASNSTAIDMFTIVAVDPARLQGLLRRIVVAQLAVAVAVAMALFAVRMSSPASVEVAPSLSTGSQQSQQTPPSPPATVQVLAAMHGGATFGTGNG